MSVIFFPHSVIMETDPAVLTHRIAMKAEDGEQSVKNVSLSRHNVCLV